MEFDLTLTTLLALVVVALVAGFVDSIAGGGGMITIPALYLAGIPPHEALGTNKFQAVFEIFSVALYKFGGNVICVSHDRELIDAYANRIIELVPQFGTDGANLPTQIIDFCGSYEEYLESKGG